MHLRELATFAYSAYSVDGYLGLGGEPYEKANELGCESVSLPAISSGIFGFPKPLCARVFFEALKNFVINSKKDETALKLQLVRLSNFDAETTEIF